jgi:hypothetical protein
VNCGCEGSAAKFRFAQLRERFQSENALKSARACPVNTLQQALASPYTLPEINHASTRLK